MIRRVCSIVYNIASNRLVAGILLIFMLVAATAAAHSWWEGSVRTKTALIHPITTQNDKAKEQSDVELITLTPDGFIPKEITHPKGKFLLVIDDRSGLQETFPKIDRIVGGGQRERLRDLNIKQFRPDWHEEQDLLPGEYLLTERDHPKWTCKLVITAK